MYTHIYTRFNYRFLLFSTLDKKGKSAKRPKLEVTYQDPSYSIPKEFEQYFTYICTVEGGDGDEFDRSKDGIRGKCAKCDKPVMISSGNYYNWRRHLKVCTWWYWWFVICNWGQID